MSDVYLAATSRHLSLSRTVPDYDVRGDDGKDVLQYSTFRPLLAVADCTWGCGVIGITNQIPFLSGSYGS